MQITFELDDKLIPSLFSALGKGETPQTVEEVTAVFVNYGLTIAGVQKQQDEKVEFENALAKATSEEIEQVKSILKIAEDVKA